MTDRTVVVELRVGESMRIGGATVALREKSGQRAKLVVTASATVDVQPPGRQKQGGEPRTGVRSNLAPA